MGYLDEHGLFVPSVAAPVKRSERYKDAGKPTGDGLMAHVIMDQSNRPITEFSLAPGQSKRCWMGRYMAEPQLMVKLHKDRFNNTEAREQGPLMDDDYEIIEDETTRARRNQFDDSLRRQRLARAPIYGSKLASPEMMPALEKLQASADYVFQATATPMPPPEKSDDLNLYRVRLLNTLVDNLPVQRKLDIPSDVARYPETLEKMESQLVESAMAIARLSPELRPVTFKDAVGRNVCEFVGQKGRKTRDGWMSPYSFKPQLMVEIDGTPVGQTAELG
jgi:hypothetical protein